MQLEIIPYEEVYTEYGDFELPKKYIEKSSLYHQGWLHIVGDGNDALVYIMPGSYHNYPDALWVSVLEVRRKGGGFGAKVIDELEDLAKGLGLKAIALHALDERARMFYHKCGFGDFGEDEIKCFGIEPGKIDEATLAQARRYATRKHNDTGAVRKHSGLPYIVHPAGVAKIAKAYGLNDDQQQASFLHDTVEDTGATIEDIEEKFGSHVAELVSELTTDNDERRRIGKEWAINNELVNMSKQALDVKLCDMLYNVSDYPDKKQKDRIFRNISYLRGNRKLTKRQDELCDAIMDCIRSSISF